MKKRSEVDVNTTWNLKDLYENDDLFNESIEKLNKKASDFKRDYAEITDSKKLKDAIKEYEDILSEFDRISTYAAISAEVDQTDDYVQNRFKNSMAKLSVIEAKISFFKSLLTKCDPIILDKFVEENSEYEHFIEMVKKEKAHILSEKEEDLLASLRVHLESGYDDYQNMKFVDIDFGTFKANGKDIPLSYNSFEEYEEYERDDERRRNAFSHFSKTIAKYQNTNASIYNNWVQMEKTMASLRGYDSVFDYLLDSQEVDVKTYNQNIDAIYEDLRKPLRKYANILKRVLKLDKLLYPDLKLSLLNDYEKKLDIKDAENIILDALSDLGEEYLKGIKRAFDERWIDYCENIGKRTGAFCASPYLVHPYIMTTYNNKMSQVMTLAHELGHAMHFLYANENQSILNTQVSRFFVESPSTANEIIIERYLLKNAKDDMERLWVLQTMISKTYYHNFVTHFIEALFQREVYKLVDEGKNLRAKDLNDIFKRILKDFWGEAVEITEGAELTWMRQPHYYMGLYPYTYSQGLTIGTKVSEKIVEKEEGFAQKWIEVLKQGSSKSPLELAKMAGVDMSDCQSVKDAVAFISEIVDEIENLVEKLGL